MVMFYAGRSFRKVSPCFSMKNKRGSKKVENVIKINDNIFRLTMDYKDIFTTVYAIKTDSGAMLFDAGSFDEDSENYMIPFLNEVGITADMLKYIFISHKHIDHAGGLAKLLESYPNCTVLSRSPQLKEEHENRKVLALDDGDSVLDVLKIVTIPGHTLDSAGIFDTRTKTLISGDCLQLYGIFGSGKWCANIRFPYEHINAVEKLRKMDIEEILTAHDYHPCGYHYRGKNEIKTALDNCIMPLRDIKKLISENHGADDAEICKMFNNIDRRPTLGDHVVTAVREMLLEHPQIL